MHILEINYLLTSSIELNPTEKQSLNK